MVEHIHLVKVKSPESVPFLRCCIVLRMSMERHSENSDAYIQLNKC